MTETFGERIARLCIERNIPKSKIKKSTGIAAEGIDRSRTISLKSAIGIAGVLGMTLEELDAPIIIRIGTAQAVRLGLVE